MSTETNDFYEMSEPDLLKHMGTDAEKWAMAFCNIKYRQGWGIDDIDTALMITWFANAIEAGAARSVPNGERA